MLTQLQKQKIARLFHIYDFDSSGVITADKAERVLRNLADIRKLPFGGPKFEAFRDGFLLYWQDLMTSIDINQDGQITLAEWLHYHDHLLQDEEKFKQTVLASSKFMFKLIDANEDGKISLDEYRLWMIGFGLRDKDIVADVFTRLDLNGDGLLSASEMMMLITDYYYSDDPNTPGSWMMGPI